MYIRHISVALLVVSGALGQWRIGSFIVSSNMNAETVGDLALDIDEYEMDVVFTESEDLLITEYWPPIENESYDNSPPLVSESPVIYYSFDEALKPRGEELVIKADRHIAGVLGMAYRFSAYEHFIRLPSKGLSLVQGSLSVWFLIEEHDGRSSYVFAHQFGAKEDYNMERKHRIEIYVKKEQLCVGMGRVHKLIVNAGKIKENVWYNVSLVWKNYECALYLNGLEIERKPFERLYKKSDCFYIGNMPPERGNERRIMGIVDELKIWNRDLTPDEVFREYAKVGESNRTI